MPATRPTLPPRFAVTSCSLGAVRVAADEGGIRAILLAESPDAARRIGAPRAARAVARASAANPLAVAIPCHRVVPGDGHAGRYRWGLERKRALLAWEALA
jgi:O-6-methylguanine DNA methyltransferase